ncbi:MAG: 50S ribosomal protein L25/general stress protein Ctc [Streptosporangiales bacterium]|nr:50S ribosomal protein L25/general stress protein Ctc [Streptosporangiales bacterium]
MSEVRIAVEPRTEFGKGAARRTRRSGRVPGVVYGHGTPPRHVSLPGHDLMLALKTPNVLLRLEGLEGGNSLALPKAVQRDPIKGFLEHVDLLVVRRGEKVVVEVPVQADGEIVRDGMLDQQLIRVEVEAEATRIPEAIEVDIEGMEVGASVHAGDLKLPGGATLVTDPEALVLHVLPRPTAEQIEAELAEAEEAAGIERPPTVEEAEAPEEPSEEEEKAD